MYEFLVLGALARGPMHGYMIAKILGNIMGPFRQVQWGALYPLLSRLEREGLIRAEESGDPGERSRKVYAITLQGRECLHQHLMDTERHLGEYDTMFTHKVTLFPQLQPEERLYLSRHYFVHAQQNVAHLQRKRHDLIESVTHLSEGEKGYILTVMDHRIEYWRREMAWAEELITENTAKEAV
jgi:DNA-binding PadR family transcriptional regulator